MAAWQALLTHPLVRRNKNPATVSQQRPHARKGTQDGLYPSAQEERTGTIGKKYDMVSVRDSARITRRGSNLPDVSKNELPTNAWLIWEAVNEELHRGGAQPEVVVRGGVPGYHWNGAVARVINDIWPDMTDSYLSNDKEGLSARRRLNGYLRNTNNMVCVDHGMQSTFLDPKDRRLPTWWVRSEWSNQAPVSKVQDNTLSRTESKLTAQEAGEDREPAPVEALFVCRKGCDRRFQSNAGRVSHERYFHDDNRTTGIYKCREGCGQEFTVATQRSDHEKAEHRDSPNRKFVCPVCSKRYYSQPAMAIHAGRQHRGVDVSGVKPLTSETATAAPEVEAPKPFRPKAKAGAPTTPATPDMPEPTITTRVRLATQETAQLELPNRNPKPAKKAAAKAAAKAPAAPVPAPVPPAVPVTEASSIDAVRAIQSLIDRDTKLESENATLRGELSKLRGSLLEIRKSLAPLGLELPGEGDNGK